MICITDREEAIRATCSFAEKNDIILLAGKGHETYQEFEDTVVPFDDRVYARETLDALSGRLQTRDYASRH